LSFDSLLEGSGSFRRADHVSNRGEQQVWLLAIDWKEGKKGQELVTAGNMVSQRFIDRRLAARLVKRKSSVSLGDDVLAPFHRSCHQPSHTMQPGPLQLTVEGKPVGVPYVPFPGCQRRSGAAQAR
jgi:hypothetical protein